MKNAVTATLALSTILLFTLRARANPNWSAGYPKTGTVAKTILVRATANFAAGTTTNGTVIVKTWIDGGGVVKQQIFTIKAGQTGAIDTGRADRHGADVEPDIQRDYHNPGDERRCLSTTIAADPATATAK